MRDLGPFAAERGVNDTPQTFMAYFRQGVISAHVRQRFNATDIAADR
jgi:hypothetical protein